MFALSDAMPLSYSTTEAIIKGDTLTVFQLEQQVY